MTKQIVIFGAGGVAREVHDVLEAINQRALELGQNSPYEFAGFIAPEDSSSHLLRTRGPLLREEQFFGGLPSEFSYVIGIGDGNLRAKIANKASKFGMVAEILIHPLAQTGMHRNFIGRGTIVCAFSSVTTDVKIGDHVFIDRNVMIGHDASLENFVSVYPSVSISGNVKVGAKSTLGTGSRIIQGLNIGRQSVVGAGAVVVKDVDPGVTVAGVPARVLGKS